MADNIGYTPGVGATVAADDIGGVIYQRLKLVLGGDGVNAGDVAVGNPMPVVGAVTTDGVTDAELRATPVPVIETSTSTLANGVQTAVGTAAVQVLAANAARKFAIIQNVGNAAVRVGVAGVTNTTGFRLAAGASVVFGMPNVLTGAIFAIREGGVGSTLLAQETT